MIFKFLNNCVKFMKKNYDFIINNCILYKQFFQNIDYTY